jgi:hypothetical protein
VKKWIALAVGATVVCAIVKSWPELVRYRRIMAM